ncbi:hypothetical protein BYT27DRAFT_7314101 [Phlegmacium glaucopus]|nr:hypothetical protein BYT27DRAFT_7314101 [Phlegmacium glaucopus]
MILVEPNNGIIQRRLKDVSPPKKEKPLVENQRKKLTWYSPRHYFAGYSLGYGDGFVQRLVPVPGNCGKLDVEDYYASVLHLIESGIAEEGPRTQFMIGGSHGGFLVAHPERTGFRSTAAENMSPELVLFRIRDRIPFSIIIPNKY